MSKIKNNLWKHVLQFGVIAVIGGFILRGIIKGAPADVEAYCPFGGLQSLGTYLNSNTLACSMSIVQIMMGIVLGVGIILFGKLFCGYLCPLGTISEWMGVCQKKMKIKIDIPTGSIADKALRCIKYALLFWIFYMTISSSELFCKNFDPYYALSTGFKGELTFWMTAISLFFLLLGNLFIHMFWCKYICPLGALSHIFKFTLTFVGLLILSLLLGYFGLSAQWIWLLGACAVVCYIYEIVYYKSKVFPLLHIVRDEEKCTGCGLCSKKCPQQIDVANRKIVKDIDCTLCTDCIGTCGEQALQVNRKPAFRWLPAIIVVVLFFLALWMGTHWELPTINERWGDPEKQEQLSSFERDGMRTVKCYGSSKAFAAKMQKVPGVYGVATYVNRFAVVIYYNPKETSKEQIEQLMFTPTKRKLNTPPDGAEKLKIITIGVDKLFDQMDITYLGNIIREKEGFYGILTEYDCPVKVKLFVDMNKQIDKKELKDIIETREFEMPVHGGEVKIIKCDFKLGYISDQVDTIGRQEFLELMFPATQSSFRSKLKTYGEDAETAIYEIAYPGLDKPIIQRQIPFLSSFLSSQEGVIEFATALKGDMPVIHITYIKELLNDDKIWEILRLPKWNIHYSDGTVKDIDARMNFKEQGKTLE